MTAAGPEPGEAPAQVGRAASTGPAAVSRLVIETPDPGLLKTTQKLQKITGDPLAMLARIRAHGIHVTAAPCLTQRQDTGPAGGS